MLNELKLQKCLELSISMLTWVENENLPLVMDVELNSPLAEVVFCTAKPTAEESLQFVSDIIFTDDIKLILLEIFTHSSWRAGDGKVIRTSGVLARKTNSIPHLRKIAGKTSI